MTNAQGSRETTPVRSALLLGGAGAIASATAQRLVRAGWRVTLAGRTASTLEAAARTLGESATFLVADATVSSDVDRALERAGTWGAAASTAFCTRWDPSCSNRPTSRRITSGTKR